MLLAAVHGDPIHEVADPGDSRVMAGPDGLGEFDTFVAGQPPHPNWTLTGLRGTGKTVLPPASESSQSFAVNLPAGVRHGGAG
ncbi:MAG: hypothetical protein A2V85_06175 [Chloroflexi bacterium RBG_16_72_14]|nr:MAG: hypothetical protein A2V85_06175 [Chloroflexi bacterium RBG_16_72_14]